MGRLNAHTRGQRGPSRFLTSRPLRPSVATHADSLACNDATEVLTDGTVMGLAPGAGTHASGSMLETEGVRISPPR